MSPSSRETENMRGRLRAAKTKGKILLSKPRRGGGKKLGFDVVSVWLPLCPGWRPVISVWARGTTSKHNINQNLQRPKTPAV